MLANMACSLIEHKRNTTVAKAKALKQFVEPITKSKLIRLITVVFVSLIYVANML
jgi:ribosomal protein L17